MIDAAVAMTQRACPVCGSDDASRVYAESNVHTARLDQFAFASRKLPEYMHHRLVECRACDLLYASPVPATPQLAKAYEEAAFDSGPEAHYAARTYARFLPEISASLPDRSGAIDIGTGDGAFLEEVLAAGFTDVVGVEPSAAPIAAADPRVRPLIRKGLFRPQDFPPGRYSLITCFQTMEHLDDPLALFRGAMDLLKPGGALFLIGHDRRALSTKLLGRKSPIFDVEHLQLFSKPSAHRLMERIGFERIRVRSFVNRYPLHYWMKLLPLPVRAKSTFLRASKAAGVGYIPCPLPAGNIAITGFRPHA